MTSLFKHLSNFQSKLLAKVRVETTKRTLEQGYEPLLVYRRRLETKDIRYLKDIQTRLEVVQADLRDTGDKDEGLKVKEQWQAGRFDVIIEAYKVALEKLTEVLDNLPEPPRYIKPHKTVDYGGMGSGV